MKKIAFASAFIVVLLFTIMLTRAITLPDRQMREQPQVITLDEEGAAGRLAGAIRFRTVSNLDPEQVDAGEFKALHAYLETSYPAVHRVLKREVVGEWNPFSDGRVATLR